MEINLKRFIIIIVIVIAGIILVPKMIKSSNESKENEAIEYTKKVVEAAKKEYEKAYEYDGIGSLTFVNADATKLDVKNKPESGTYTIVTKDNKIFITTTNLKFGKYYCQYDGEKATCDKKKVQIDESKDDISSGEKYEDEETDEKDYETGVIDPDKDEELSDGKVPDIKGPTIGEIETGKNFPKE